MTARTVIRHYDSDTSTSITVTFFESAMADQTEFLLTSLH